MRLIGDQLGRGGGIYLTTSGALAPPIQITTGAYLDPALMVTGAQIGAAFVPGSYPDYQGNVVVEETITYYIDGVEVLSTYVLQSGDVVGAALVHLTAGAATRDYYAEPTTVTDFSYSTADFIYTVPAGGGDTTAPVLTSPIGTATGQTTADGGVTTDEGNGTIWMVTSTSATQPTAAQIKAGQDHASVAAAFADSQAVTTSGPKSFAVTGVSAATAYYCHYMHEDASANQSAVVSSAEFTTDAAGSTIQLVGSAWAAPVSGNITVDLTALTGGIASAAAAGDLVILFGGKAHTINYDVAAVTAGYAELADLYSNDGQDTNLGVFSKFMTATPDTSAELDAGGTSVNGAAAFAVVFRGVNPTTPLDVAIQTATGIDGNLADPPAITPFTAGAMIMGIYAGSNDDTFTAPTPPANLTDWRAGVSGGSTSRLQLGFGLADWTSGAFDPDPWSGTDNEATTSWAAVTIALRPA